MMKKQWNYAALLTIVVLLAYSAWMMPLTFSYSHGPNYENVSVDTQVNVTNAKPEIMTVLIENGNASVILTAGGTETITCFVMVMDYNGGDDIAEVNATLHYYLNDTSDPLNNNTLYRNYTCLGGAAGGPSGYYKNFTCNFEVYYFALNGTWYCNATAIDDFNFTDTEWNTTVFDPLYALNVTRLIDYGDLPVTNTSKNKTANVTNFGNTPINITVFSFGAVEDDGLAMNCTQRNISAVYQKWSIQPDEDYAAKTSASGTQAGAQQLGMTIAKATQAGSAFYSTNITYWQIQVPEDTNPFGICNGTLVFTAELP
ncbi:MAG: hypothetical protein ABIE94_01940 [archaeon]